MKLGGPWNFRGRRPRAEEPAPDIAPRPGPSGVSVGEWLNSVIQRSDGEDEPDAPPSSDRREFPPAAPERRQGGPYRHSALSGRPERRREPLPYRAGGRDERHAPPLEDAPDRDAARAEPQDPNGTQIAEPAALSDQHREARDGASRPDEFDEVNARLDKLAEQLHHLARVAATPSPPAPVEPQRRRAAAEPPISIDDAVAEIAARQRVLDGEAAVPAEAAAPAEAPASPAALDFASLEQLLHQITARVEALQPSSEIESAITAVRSDLAEISRQLNEALPRHALESLESEIRALAERIDCSRQAGADPDALAGIEHGLAEVRDALRGLTPAENLVGADEAVSALAQKVDMILARDDPAVLQQLEAAIGGLRGVVSHVASNDTLNKVAEDVHVLAAQVDALASNAASADAVASLEQRIDALTAALHTSGESGDALLHDGDTNTATAAAMASLEQRLDALTAALQTAGQSDHLLPHDAEANAATAAAVAALEQRIDALTAALQTVGQYDHGLPHDADANAATAAAVASLDQRIDSLTAALQASSEAGRAVPQDLEKLLAGLIEKLEWVQLTHTDHAALGHLEDRIAMLVKRFDASEARFAQLEGIERGLTDLLVHIEQMRGAGVAVIPASAAWQAPAAEPAPEWQASEARHDDSPLTMQDTIEHVADRLAMIESNVYDAAGAGVRAERLMISEPPPAPQHGAAEPIVGDEMLAMPAAAPASHEPAAPLMPSAAHPAVRAPIDPTLPPDHPLEPGFTGSRPRNASAAERVAASEAAIGSAKPPVIPDAGRPNFIAAARRAAQAAAWEPSTAKAGQEPELADPKAQSTKLSDRLRKLVVAGSALLIVLGCARIAMRLLDDGHTINVPPMHSGQIAAPATALPAPAPAPLAKDSAPASSAPANAPAARAPSLPRPAVDAKAPPPAPPPAQPGNAEQQSQQLGGATQTVAGKAAPSGAEPAANALPAWATPDITGTLPPGLAGPDKARTAAPVASASDDTLPAAIGDPALRAAATGGDPAAAYEIAARFAEGRGVPKNNAAAAHWLERAAKQGLVPAQFRLGGLYEKGIGVQKDLARARDLYLAAAEKGNGKAMHNLAVLYAEGVDGSPDYTSAAEWFRRGAEHGVSDSQYNLGILYGRGIGVTQDYAASYKWFALAANQGDHDAAAKRDEVAGHLDPKALEAARAAVQNFKPEPQPDDAVNVKTAAAWQTPAKPK